MKFYTKSKKDEIEYIALSSEKKKYKIVNPLSEVIKINSKNTEIKIFETEEGFTYLEWNKRKIPAEIVERNQNKVTVMIDGISFIFTIETPLSYKRRKVLDKQQVQSKVEAILAPMPGKIVDIMVEENSEVKEGEAILILEAMKMQNEINAPISGKVKKVLVKQNDAVLKDDILIEIDK